MENDSEWTIKLSSRQKIEASVVILTKNEEKHVKRAIDSASEFSEVIVVDSNSMDKTAEISSDAGARVIDFTWNKAYPKKKEWALEHTKYDWTIYLDADEFFEPNLVDEIRQAVADPENTLFEVPLKYYWMSKELKYGHRVSKRIGMRKSQACWPRPNDLHVKNMWEVEGHYQPQSLTGKCEMLMNTMGHKDEDGLYEYFSRHNRYSDWEAHMLVEKDSNSHAARSRMGRMAVNLPAKPLIFFIYSYFIKRGFLDGRAGFNYALALSFYYWQINVKSHEVLNLMSNDAKLTVK